MMCTYCGKHFDSKIMTPLYEKGKTLERNYCPKCLPDVNYNISTVHWKDNLWFGLKGERSNDS